MLERLGRVRVAELLKAFSEEEYLRQQAFSREAVRLLSTANSTRLGRRLYKVLVVIDLEGLSLSHVGSRFVRLCKRVNETFGWHYPETAFRFYVINAPLVFRTAWGVAKSFIHPITVQKFSILGSGWRRTFAEAGITLTTGEASPTSWSAAVRAAVEEHGPELLGRGYMPADDLERLGLR